MPVSEPPRRPADPRLVVFVLIVCTVVVVPVIVFALIFSGPV